MDGGTDPTPTIDVRPQPAAAVALWAGVQLVALWTAAAGVHLWPHHPDPPESLALGEVVVVQMTTAALLFPRLFADPLSTVVAITLILPFQALAGLLSVTSGEVVAELATVVSIWVGGLAALARSNPGPRSSMIAQPIVVLFTIGGPILLYARAEALASGGQLPPEPTFYGPLATAVALTSVPDAFAAGLYWASVPLLAAALCAAPRVLRNSPRELN